MARYAFTAAALIATGYAQIATNTIPASVAADGTMVANPSAFVTGYNFTVDDLWNIFVGPVSKAYITTTASATPVPASSLVPPPPIYYSPFPTGQQVPASPKNESWKFPSNYLLGVAGAAYQVEGAAMDEGRGPSIWDVWSHRVTDAISLNGTADITDNHYYQYKQDIARIAAIGVNTYSLTISWSRVLPFGKGQVNQLAIDHYNDVINTALQYNLTPTVTLYHWDTPLVLQDAYGGWLSEDIVDDFVAYAKICFEAFGDRVKYWITVNEPIVFCDEYPLPQGYYKNTSIPHIQQPYYCGQNVLLAHSQAYHLGKAMIPNSMITFKDNGGHKIPLTNSTADAEAVQRSWDFAEGWFADPIYLTGDYPASVKAYTSTFLPDFTAAQKALINGSADFFAYDAYTANFVFAPDAGIAACVANASNPLYPSCANSSYTYSAEDGGWLIGPAADPGSPWLHKTTDFVPSLLAYVQKTWKPKGGILVSEFGFAEPFEYSKQLLPDILYDPVRMSYYHDYMEAILISISEGVNVIGSIAWSFVDNFEWAQGFSVKFGMQYVNFTDPTLPRYYKASFFEYTGVYKQYVE